MWIINLMQGLNALSALIITNDSNEFQLNVVVIFNALNYFINFNNLILFFQNNSSHCTLNIVCNVKNCFDKLILN